MYMDVRVTVVGLDEFPDRGNVGRKGNQVL